MNNYTQTSRFQVALNRLPITYMSKPGIPAWDRVTPSAYLLAENITLNPTDRVLLMGCGHGAIAVPLASQLRLGELWLSDPSFIALHCSRLTLELNQVTNAHVSESLSLLPSQANTFNTVLIDLPKGRQLGQRWLVEAYGLLVPGGTVYMSGPNDMGIQSLIKDGQELFGNSGVLGYKKGSRLARFVKTHPASSSLPEWASKPGIAPGTWKSFTLKIDQDEFKIYSLPGVFSQDQLDDGTYFLLQHAPQPNGPSVLDLGCGAGLIGMVVATRIRNVYASPAIDLIDSNLLAVASAQKNLLANQIPSARAIPGDLLASIPDRRYHQIISNPPFHAGKEINFAITEALIAQSLAALEPGGELVLVANRFIRYDKLMKKLFPQVQILAEDKRYHIITGRK